MIRRVKNSHKNEYCINWRTLNLGFNSISGAKRLGIFDRARRRDAMGGGTGNDDKIESASHIDACAVTSEFVLFRAKSFLNLASDIFINLYIVRKELCIALVHR